MIYYNPIAFKNMLGSKYKEEYHAFYLNRGSICKMDRSGLFTKFNFSDKFKWNNLFPLPKYEPYNLTFEETCFNRAEQLLRDNEKMTFWWSGGCDSTTALLAFHQYKEAHSKILVVMTEASVSDNPGVFETIIKPHYNYVVLKKFADRLPYWSLEYPNVTGDVSEGIYGWSGLFQIFLERYGIELAHTKIEDAGKFEQIMTSEDWKNFSYFLKLDQIIYETYKACPIKVETLLDMNWWFVYNFCWQYDYLRFMVPLYSNYELAFKYTEPFYADVSFENWVVNNYDTVITNITHVNNWKIDELNFIRKYCPAATFEGILPRKTNVEVGDLAPKGFLMINDNYDLVPCPRVFEGNFEEMKRLFGYEFDEEEIRLLFD